MSSAPPGAHPVSWTMPAALLSGTAAAAGIALIDEARFVREPAPARARRTQPVG